MSTVGIELEWSDVDRWATIPPEIGRWSDTDYSIVNSDGHANCPKGEKWRWGGEINTVPTETAEEQATITCYLAELLSPTVNYKSNLHVHVRPTGFDEIIKDATLLRGIAWYLRKQEAFVYSKIDPLPRPTEAEYPDREELKGAVKRWRRNLTSHQYSLPKPRWEELIKATTPEQFKNAHAAPTSTGKRAWHVAPRPGMNMRSLWKHGTIEFRHFFGTTSGLEVESAVRWCQLIVDNAVAFARDKVFLDAEEIYNRGNTWRFPRQMRYDHRLQLGFEASKPK